MASRRNFDAQKYEELPIEQKLTDCRIAIASIRDTLRPFDPHFKQIDLHYLLEILNELNIYFALFYKIAHSTDLKDLEILYIESHCESVSAVNTYLEKSIRFLTVASRAKDAMENLPKKFDADLENDCLTYLSKCRDSLSDVLLHISEPQHQDKNVAEGNAPA